MRRYAGAVADGKHCGIAARGQRRLDGEEAAPVQRQAGAGKPFGGTRLGDDEDIVGFQALAVLEMDSAGLDPCGRRILKQPHAAPGEDRAHFPARRSGLARQDLALGGQGDGDLGVARYSPQPMVDGERQFDTARAAADHSDAQRSAMILYALEEGEPAPAELGDRLHRCCMLGRTRDRLDSGRGADIEREQVVGNRRPVS